MILQSLAKMARRDGLVENPAFQSVPVRWIVTLDAEGHFQTLDNTDYTPPAEGKRKPKVQYKKREIPRRSGRTSGDKEEFLVDKSDYVLGILPEGDADNAKRRKLFREALETAQNSVTSTTLDAAVRFLSSDGERQRCIDDLRNQPFASNDLFTFRVGGTILDEVPELRTYWEQRVAASAEKGAVAQCLICGERKPMVDKHDSLKLPGAVTSGVALVSFNAGAFEKHGLDRNANAPVCRDCMVAYVNGLRRCLEENYPNPEGGSFRKQSTRLGDDTVAVYWDDESSPLSGLLALLSGDNPGQVKSLFEAAWKGLRPGAASERFYCLLLTGVQGRASVRGMHTSTLQGVKNSLFGIEQRPGYFACIESAVGTEKPAPISTLLASLALPGKSAQLPSSLGEELFLNAILAQPLSQFFLTTAVTRTRAERKVTWPRAALLQLYFQRSLKPGMRKPPMSLDVNEPDAAYRYGRLLAVLEDLQIRYHNRKPNSTIVDRFYAAASTRPATAFPRLLTLAQNHLRTVKYADNYSRSIQEILGGLPGAQGFKSTLNLEEQGRFALGFFQQKNEIFRLKTERSGKKDAAETASNEPEEKSATEEEE
ncbi:MAG: type I-C CRISPR-associated protein Cas8c/Csd1 [Terracidiphilus sp.]|nr:type I-C CRISPR-associated protein Cas8c/Csd1 [Terracidiphilus sp.]